MPGPRQPWNASFESTPLKFDSDSGPVAAGDSRAGFGLLGSRAQPEAASGLGLHSGPGHNGAIMVALAALSTSRQASLSRRRSSESGQLPY